MGEVVMRGNNVMSGYYDDEAATGTAFAGGWFHSGDLAIWHPDGNIELRDRGKDIIISGGENISSIEVEQAIAAHPAVLECAVIGIPHPHWGERPKAGAGGWRVTGWRRASSSNSGPCSPGAWASTGCARRNRPGWRSWTCARRGWYRRRRWSRPSARTRMTGPPTPTAGPSATWCAPSAGITRTRLTLWRSPAARTSWSRCWTGAATPASRRSRSAAAPAWSAGSNRMWETAIAA